MLLKLEIFLYTGWMNMEAFFCLMEQEQAKFMKYEDKRYVRAKWENVHVQDTVEESKFHETFT